MTVDQDVQRRVDTAMQPFAQLGEGYGKQFQGRGLGLPIIETLAELHDSTLEIVSLPDHGATVTISFS